MWKKLSIVLAVLLIALMGSVPPGVNAQVDAVATDSVSLRTPNGYEARVAAVSRQYASQRTNLSLSNAPGGTSTPEGDLGCKQPPDGYFAPNNGFSRLMDKAWNWLRDVTGAQASEMAFEAKCESEWAKWSECRDTLNEGVCEDNSWRFEKNVEYCDSYVSQECQDDANKHTRAVAGVRGAPKWIVNRVNLNFYMTDIPLWYSPPIGPKVDLRLSYNSFASNTGPVGKKWQLNYGSYLYTVSDNHGMPAGTAVIMPDGKWDVYGLPGANGLCSPPYQVFNTLTKITNSRYELKFTNGTLFVYDIPSGTTSSVSLLVETRDAHGQKLTLNYDASAKLTSVTDATGNSTTFYYNASGFLTQATDPFGRFASFDYDVNGNLAKITDMGGYWTSFTYDTNSYLTGMTNADGTWTFYFEPQDFIYNGDNPYPAPGTAMGGSSRITITNPALGKEEYYRFGDSAWHISPKNYIPYVDASHNNYASNAPRTHYGFSLVTARRGELGSITTPEGYARDFSYTYSDDSSDHSAGNLIGMSYPEGAFGLTYNTMGKVTSVTEIWGIYQPVTTLTYASNEVDLTNITDDLGTVTLGYNNFHDITSIMDRSGNTKSFTFNAYGQITSITDPLGTVTNYIYDANHYLSKITRNGQTLKSYTRDAAGRIKTYTDVAGSTLTYDYNNLDDTVKITYPDGRDVGKTYSDSIPHLVTSNTDRSGLTTQYAFNALGQLTQILNPEGGSIAYAYDANGNIVQLTDPRSNVTTFQYNNDNKLIKKTFADSTFELFTYEGGQLYSHTNARNGTSSYAYDGPDTIGHIYYSDGFTYAIMNQHDKFHRLTTAIDESGTHNYSYDANSRLTVLDGPLTNDNITFQYDAAGRKTGYTLQGGQSMTYTYDAFDRITQLQNIAGTFTFSYGGASPLVQRLTRPNGTYTDYQYDTLLRLTGVTNRSSAGTIINQYLYSYNDQDLRTSETITNGTAITTFQNESVTYTYNSVNRLTSSTNRTGYTHDADGNMTNGYTPDGVLFTATYDTENRMQSIAADGPDQCTLPQYPQFPFPCPHSRDYKYRYDGSLTQVKKQDGTASSVTTNYVGFGRNPLQERDKNNNVIKEYTWGPDLWKGFARLLSLRQSGQDYYYLYDGKGNVTAIIDNSQAVVAAYAYDPFGKLMTKTGTLDQPYQFLAELYDEKTGLCYSGQRYYSPDIGRWIVRDTENNPYGLPLYGFTIE